MEVQLFFSRLEPSVWRAQTESLQSATEVSDREQSTIQSESSSGSSGFFACVFQFLSGVCTWIKTHIFCLCLDEKSEKIRTILKELNSFHSTAVTIGANKESIKKKFKEMSLISKLELAEGIAINADLEKALSDEGKKIYSVLKAYQEEQEMETAFQALSPKSRGSLKNFLSSELSQADPFERAASDSDIQQMAEDSLLNKEKFPSIIKGVRLILLKDIITENPLLAFNGQLLIPRLILAACGRMKNQLED